MAASGKMEFNFDKLLANYRDFEHLPDYIKKLIDGLNAPIKKRNLVHEANNEQLEKLNTSCCLQVSDALNQTEPDPNKRIGPKSLSKFNSFRDNVQLPSGSGLYCVGNVLELEEHLKAAYGEGEEVKTDPKMTLAAAQALLKDRQGIVLFRDGGTGFHTELWNKTSIIQNGAPSADGSRRGLMSSEIWNQKRVAFWEAIGDLASRVGVVPDWLEGWWDVKDGISTFYYYFSRSGWVHSTQVRPNIQNCPVTNRENSGTFKIDNSRNIIISWNVGPLTREVFAPIDITDPPMLSGSNPGQASLPFTATKAR